jgi:hypothetical protein
MPRPCALARWGSPGQSTRVYLDACQSYLASTSSDLKVKKVVALKRGPKHPYGLTIVGIINHAANFGKHDDDWSLPSSPCEALDKLFVDDSEYSLTTLLRALVFAPSNRLQAVLPHLRRWRDALQQTGDPP